MENSCYEISIAFDSRNYDDICNTLYIHGIETILEESSEIIFYLDETGKKKLDAIRKDLLEKNIIRDEDIYFGKFEDKNWNKEWEKSIEPVYIKDRIIVYPSWKKNELKNPEGKVLIEIDPKMSFGTGHNETTQLMLEMMADHIDGTEEKILDFGCGTAVLAIAGVKLGIKSATAIDIDEDSIENAKEYIERNSVQDKISLQLSGINEVDEYEFDIICANIIRSVIVETFGEIEKRLKPGGKLFLSGILCSEDMPIAVEMKRYGFEVLKKYYKAEWAGYFAMKR